jgi:hypothetical protein
MRLTHPDRPCSLHSFPVCLLCLSSCHISCKIFLMVHSALSRVSYRNLFGGGCTRMFLLVGHPPCIQGYILPLCYILLLLNILCLIGYFYVRIFSHLVPWKVTKRLSYVSGEKYRI